MFKFNVGTAIQGVDRSLDAIKVFQTLESVGFRDVRIVGVKLSGTETTLIIEADRYIHANFPGLHKSAVMVACKVFKQDCIAYRLNDTGYLVGPKAAAWGGAFNPDYFLE